MLSKSNLRLIFLAQQLSARFDSYREYAGEMEGLLKALRAEQDTLHKDAITGLSEEDADAYLEHYGAQYDLVAEEMPAIHRRSTLLTLYSLLEHRLTELCYIISGLEDSTPSFQMIKNIGIVESAKSYLKANIVGGVDFDKPAWIEVRIIQLLRNKIVHNDGLIPSIRDNEDDSQLSPEWAEAHEYIKNSPHLSLTGQGDLWSLRAPKHKDRVAIGSGFAAHCASLFEASIRDILVNIPRVAPLVRSV